MKGTGKKYQKPIKVVIYILAVFLFQEAVLRLCYPLPELKNLDRSAYQDQEGKVHAYTRNQGRFWQSSLDTSAVFEHHMNRYGFRDVEWKMAKPSHKKRVLFIGDSFVEGIMASQKQTIPEGFLQAAGAERYEVFNAGMVGRGLNAYLQLLADIVPIFKPDVVVFCIYANDLGQKEPLVPPFFLEPEYFSFWSPRFLTLLQESQKRGSVPAIWSSQNKAFLPSVPAPSNPWSQNEAKLAPHVKAEVATAMKSGKFNPFRTNALAKEAKHLKLNPKLGESVPFFRYICQQNKAKPLIVYIPCRNQVTRHYYRYEQQYCLKDCPDTLDLTTPEYQLHARVLQEQCKSLNVPFVDLSPLIKGVEDRGQRLFWNYDEHMKGKGYLLLGKNIWEQWNRSR